MLICVSSISIPKLQSFLSNTIAKQMHIIVLTVRLVFQRLQYETTLFPKVSSSDDTSS